MPQWCSKHAQHTIDEVCSGCEIDSLKWENVGKMIRDHSPAQLREIAAKLLNAADRKAMQKAIAEGKKMLAQR